MKSKAIAVMVCALCVGPCITINTYRKWDVVITGKDAKVTTNVRKDESFETSAESHISGIEANASATANATSTINVKDAAKESAEDVAKDWATKEAE